MGLCSQSVRVAAAGACLNTGNYFQLLCDLPLCVLILAFFHRNPWWSLQKLSKISWRNGDVVSYAGFRCTAFNKSPSAASICICLAAQWRRVWTNMNFNPRQPRRGGARMRGSCTVLISTLPVLPSCCGGGPRPPALSSYAPDPVKIFTQQLRKYLLRGNRSARQPNGTAITLPLNPRR